MRYYFWAILALNFTFDISAQSPTVSPKWASRHFHHQNTQNPYRIIEYEDGYLLPLNFGSLGTSVVFSDTNARACLLRMDENLNVVDSFYVDKVPGAYTILSRVIYRNQKIYLMISDDFDMFSSQFRWIILDRNFNHIGGRTQSLDSIFVTEYATEINVSYVAFLVARNFNETLIMEMSYNGDSVRFREIDNSSTQIPVIGYLAMPHNLFYLPNINSYLLSSRLNPAMYLNFATGEIDSLGATWVSQQNIFSNPARRGSFYYTGFIRSHYEPGLPKIARANLNGTLDTVVEIPKYHNTGFKLGGVRQTVSINHQSEIYTLHLENFWTGDSGQHDIIVSKFDDSMALKWHKAFDVQRVSHNFNSTSISPMSILATSDGGCLLSFVAPKLGSYNFQYPKLFLLKLDANGSALSQTELEIPQYGFKVFPNPGSEYFEISIEGVKMKNGKIKVYDSLGNLVLLEDLDGRTKKIDAHMLNFGLYYVEVQDDENNRVLIEKWIKAP